MASHNQQRTPFVLNNYISVQVAGNYNGYSLQYLRRLLRNGKLGGIKIGQLWLVEKGALDTCLERVQNTADQRFRAPFWVGAIIFAQRAASFFRHDGILERADPFGLQPH